MAVTTVGSSAATLAGLLGGAGMEPVMLPCISIEPGPAALLDQVRSMAATADWLVITSPRVVAVVWPGGGMPDVPVGAVGRATAQAVSEAGGRVAVVGAGGGGDLAARLAPLVDGMSVLLPRSQASRPATARALRRAAATVVEAEVYRTVPVAPAGNQVDAAIFGSPSAVTGWCTGRSLAEVELVAAIGATTASALAAAGRDADIIAPVPRLDALVGAVSQA